MDAQNIIATIRLGLDELDKDCKAAQTRIEKMGGNLEKQGEQAGKVYVQGFGKGQQDLNKKLSNMVSTMSGISPKMGAIGEKMAGMFSKPIFSMVPAVTMAFQAMLPVIGTILVAVGGLVKAIQAGAKAQKEFSDNVKLAGNAADILNGKTRELSETQKKKNELDQRGAVATAKIQLAMKNLGDAISGFLAPAVNFLNGLWVGFLENLGKIAAGIGTVMAAIGTVVPGIGVAGAALIAFGASVESVSEVEAEAARNAQALKEQNAGLVQSYDNLQSALKNTETAEKSGAVTAAEAANARLAANQSYLDSLIQLRTETEELAQKNGMNAASELAAYDKKIAAQVAERDSLKKIADAYADEAAKAKKASTIIADRAALEKKIGEQVKANNILFDAEIELLKKQGASSERIKAAQDERLEKEKQIYAAGTQTLAGIIAQYDATEKTAPAAFKLLNDWTAIAGAVGDSAGRSKELQAVMDEQADAIAAQAIARAQEKGDILTAIDLQKQLIGIQRERSLTELKASEKYRAASKEDQEAILADFQRVTDGMKAESESALREAAKTRQDILDEQADSLLQIETARAAESGDIEKQTELENRLMQMQRSRAREQLVASAEYQTASDEDRKVLTDNFDAITASMEKTVTAADKFNAAMNSDIGKAAQKGANSVADTMLGISQIMTDQIIADAEEAMAKIDADLAAKKQEIEEARNAALMEAGFIEAQTAEDMQAKIDAAKEAGDEVLQYELERKQEEMAINEEYDRQAVEAEYQAEIAKAGLQYEADKAKYQMDIANASVSMAKAIMEAVTSGMQFGLAAPAMVPVLTAMAAALGGVQIGVIASHPPKKATIPPPKFADGGFVPGNPRAGDVQQILATAGERVQTADDVQNELRTLEGGGGQGIVLYATFKLDREKIGEAVFDWANKRGAVLDARAIIG